MMQNPETHTFVSGSNAEIWCPIDGEGCTRMPKVCKDLVDKGVLDFSRREQTENEYQRFGTDCHELAAKLLVETKMPLTPNSDEFFVANNYAEFIQDSFAEFKDTWKIETKLNLTEDVGGTGDFTCYDNENNKLIIADLKTGYQLVDAEMNSQLAFYAACQIDEYPNCKSVDMYIYQPLSDDLVSFWSCDIEVIKNYKTKLLKTLELMESEGVLRPSLERCNWCKAKPLCLAFREKLQTVFEVI